MIFFENANRQLTELPRNIQKIIPKSKPNILSSSKKKHIYYLLKLWSYSDDNDINKYLEQLTLLTLLHWSDYKSFTHIKF